MPPEGNAGLVAALEIRERFPDTRVLVLSQYLEPEYALRLLDGGSGGVGYLLKDRLGEPRELADAARRVATGGSAIDPMVVDELVRARRADDRVGRLTDREREILGTRRRGPLEPLDRRAPRPLAQDRRRRDRRHLLEALPRGGRARQPSGPRRAGLPGRPKGLRTGLAARARTSAERRRRGQPLRQRSWRSSRPTAAPPSRPTATAEAAPQ